MFGEVFDMPLMTEKSGKAFEESSAHLKFVKALKASMENNDTFFLCGWADNIKPSIYTKIEIKMCPTTYMLNLNKRKNPKVNLTSKVYLT